MLIHWVELTRKKGADLFWKVERFMEMVIM